MAGKLIMPMLLRAIFVIMVVVVHDNDVEVAADTSLAMSEM